MDVAWILIVDQGPVPPMVSNDIPLMFDFAIFHDEADDDVDKPKRHVMFLSHAGCSI
jgi:hypothetical protein